MPSIPSTRQPAADALEQRDPWRGVWQVVTNDGLLLALCLVIFAVVALGNLLPQAPAGGTSDPLSYSQWQTQARSVAGSFYDTASALSLFEISQAFWLRILVILAAMMVSLRLIDRLVRVFKFQHVNDQLREEERLRVTDRAPSLDDMAARLAMQRYRVTIAQPGMESKHAVEYSWLVVDRAPWAELLSMIFHIGLLLLAAGILVDLLLGWDVIHQQVGSDSARLQSTGLDLRLAAVNMDDQTATLQIQGDNQVVTLSLQRSVQLYWVPPLPLPCCLALHLNEVTPGFDISAVDAAGIPLTITASSYAEPAQSVMLALRQDEPGRLIAVEAAGLAVLVSRERAGSVKVYGVPVGNVLTDTVISSTVVISGTTLQFKPETSVDLAARYRPGSTLIWPGAVLSLLGLGGVLAWPMRRLVIRHHGHWTEFYASGRGIRRVVRELSQQKGVEE